MSLVYRSASATHRGDFGSLLPPDSMGKGNGGRKQKQFNILIVDDEPVVRSVVEMAVHEAGHKSVSAIDGADGLSLFEKGKFDMIVTDISMPRINGVELLRAVREEDVEVKVIMFSGDANLDVEGLKRMGANDVLRKPCGIGKIIDTIARNLPSNS